MASSTSHRQPKVSAKRDPHLMGRSQRIGMHVYVSQQPPTPEQLLQLLISGGPLTVRNPDPEGRRRWRQVIDALRVGGGLPPNHHLVFQGRDSGDLRIEIGLGPHPSLKYRDHSEAPTIDHDGASGHVAVDALTTDGAWNIDEALTTRAKRVLEVLARGLEQRGHEVAAGRDGADPALVVRVGSACWTIRIEEIVEVVDAYPPLDELRRMYPWQRVHPHRVERSTGRLRIISPAGWGTNSRHVSWADTSRWALESKLAEIVAELEQRRHP